MRRICDAHDVFNVCVTHAMMFLRFDVTHLRCSCDFKICATRTVTILRIRQGQLFNLPDAFLMLDVFLMRHSLMMFLCCDSVITSVALDRCCVRIDILTRCGFTPMKVFTSCSAAFFFTIRGVSSLLTYCVSDTDDVQHEIPLHSFLNYADISI